MTSSTDTRAVIVLGDKDTGSRLEMRSPGPPMRVSIAVRPIRSRAVRRPSRTTSPTSAPRSQRCARPFGPDQHLAPVSAGT